MADFERTVIVGVGLLGGSIGKALRERNLSGTVVGVGRRLEPLQVARDLGAIDEFEVDIETACAAADLVVVCTPVQQVVDYVRRASTAVQPDALMTDVGSTKASICQQLQRLGVSQFCGSHPLAGSDKSGVEYADAALFVDKTVVVTPTEETQPASLERVEKFWQSLGSRTLQMKPLEHDDALAITSHLPHVAASALAAATPEALLPLAASGWCDTTRVAAGSVELWLQILEENREPVLAALASYSNSLQTWIEALEHQDAAAIESLLTLGKNKRDSVGN